MKTHTLQIEKSLRAVALLVIVTALTGCFQAAPPVSLAETNLASTTAPPGGSGAIPQSPRTSATQETLNAAQTKINVIIAASGTTISSMQTAVQALQRVVLDLQNLKLTSDAIHEQQQLHQLIQHASSVASGLQSTITTMQSTLTSCKSSFHLQGGACVANICDPGVAQSCQTGNGTGSQTCNATGSAWGACGNLTSCKSSFHLQGGACVANICDPGVAQSCQTGNGTGSQTCNESGSAWGACGNLTSCKSSFHLQGGACVANICDPGVAQSCQTGNGTGSQTCNATGSAWGACGNLTSCKSSFHLQGGACVANICDPGVAQSCQTGNGTGSQTCNASGSAWGACGNLTSCQWGFNLQGSVCVANVCSPGSWQSCHDGNGTGNQMCKLTGLGWDTCANISSCDPGHYLFNVNGAGACLKYCTVGTQQACSLINGSGGQQTCRDVGLGLQIGMWSQCSGTCDQGFFWQAGQCVSKCAEGFHAQNGVCEWNSCTPNSQVTETISIGTRTVTCNSIGSDATVTYLSCTSDFKLKNGQCVAKDCSPGALKSCSIASSNPYAPNTWGNQTCSASGEWDSTCTPQLCSPGSRQNCVDPVGSGGTQACNESGTGWGTCGAFTSCTSGYHLNDYRLCVAGTCNPETVQSCQSGNGPGQQRCDAKGQSWGACQPAANGVCGGANGVAAVNMPTANLCAVGTSESLDFLYPPGFGSSYTWRCQGFNGGDAEICHAPNIAPTSSCSEATCDSWISTPSDFARLSTTTPTRFCLKNDINFSGFDPSTLFIPKSKGAISTIRFNGCGNTIRNLSLTQGPLFASLNNSTVEGLNFDNLSINLSAGDMSPGMDAFFLPLGLIGNISDSVLQNIKITNLKRSTLSGSSLNFRPTNDCGLLAGTASDSEFRALSISGESFSTNSCFSSGGLVGNLVYSYSDKDPGTRPRLSNITLSLNAMNMDYLNSGGGLIGMSNAVSMSNIAVNSSLAFCTSAGMNTAEAVGGIIGFLGNDLRNSNISDVSFSGNMTSGIIMGMDFSGRDIGGVGGFVGVAWGGHQVIFFAPTVSGMINVGYPGWIQPGYRLPAGLLVGGTHSPASIQNPNLDGATMIYDNHPRSQLTD